MAPIHIVLFVSTSCCLVLCDVITAEDDTKSDFVDVLRRDLRRNNDDYVETSTGALNITNPYLASSLRDSAEDQRLLLNDSDTLKPLETGRFYYKRDPLNTVHPPDNSRAKDPNRRQFDTHDVKSLDSFSREDSVVNRTDNVYTAFETTARNVTIRKIVTSRPSTVNLLTTLKMASSRAPDGLVHFRSGKSHGPQAKWEKIERFKKFIEKNKELFNEFMAKKRAEAEEQVRERRLREGQPARPPPPLAARDGTARIVQAFQQVIQSEEEARFRARPPPLTADQLDMAPARGGKVHAMRIKGRLCQRSVLVPEGPKYNKRGTAYVAAYAHRDGRDYARTRSPRLLLPRCCNCCSKSLLGCE